MNTCKNTKGTEFIANAVMVSFFQGQMTFYKVLFEIDAVGNPCMCWIDGGWAQCEISEDEYDSLQGEKIAEGFMFNYLKEVSHEELFIANESKLVIEDSMFSDIEHSTTSVFLADKKSIDAFGGYCSLAYDIMLHVGAHLPDEFKDENFTDIVYNENNEVFAYYSEHTGDGACQYVKVWVNGMTLTPTEQAKALQYRDI